MRTRTQRRTDTCMRVCARLKPVLTGWSTKRPAQVTQDMTSSVAAAVPNPSPRSTIIRTYNYSKCTTKNSARAVPRPSCCHLCPASAGSRKTLDGTGGGAHGSPTNQFPSSAKAPNQPGPPGPPCSLQDRKGKLHECATTKPVRTLPNEQRRFLKVTISTRLKPCVQVVVSFRPVLRGHCIVPTIAVGDALVDDRTGVSGLHRPACSDQLRD